ncbi:MAG: hypothetical protein JJE30_15245 [Desulfuromonadales bacterium]|nr:hypothetical protein [Desulfuromonadales bacterium]
MKSKKFTLFMVVAILAFPAFNFLVWKLCTEVLLTKKYDGGDLARTSYILASKYYRKNAIDLPRKHFLLDFANREQKKIDILTLGDSFSMGLGEGKNHFYQDYLATNLHAEVANVFPYPTSDAVMLYSPLTNLILLYNSGVLDDIMPKYVLIESIERYCVQRFSHAFDFSTTEPKEKLVKYFSNQKYNFDYLPVVGFLNTGNPKFLYYNLLYMFSDKAFHDQIVYRKLTKPLFSVNGSNILFTNQDVSNVKLVTDESVEILNANLNEMARLLEKKHIRLIFMPIVDKYNLYSDYIADNPYPKSIFFEKLRKLPKMYMFVDTKQLLKEELDKGVMDVYFPDDTHWSWKAPEKIFKSVRFP